MKKSLLVICFFLFFWGFNSAQADIIEIDLTPGDALITRDTNTGLEWLDLSATDGMSYNDVLVSQWYTEYGFHHATEEEFVGFFTNVTGIQPGTGTTSGGYDRYLDVSGPEYHDQIATLVYYMGTTHEYTDPYNPAYSYSWSTGQIQDTYLAPYLSQTSHRAIRITLSESNGTVNWGSPASGFASEPDERSGYAGHFLIRNFTQTSQVPESATMLLFSIGLLGIAGVSRRKK
ncbi:MAG: PEP-CTERM sorting domain-containing protein [Desulfobacter sp.]|nr:MAG: PEP-CTERM sorting domain-containing protein [Desulfobacter sp.]